MTNFTLLKHLDITIIPGKNIHTMEVIWSPPLMEWLKGNIDGAAKGTPSLAACGGILRDSLANHIVSFSSFLGNEDSVFAEFFAIIMALEIAMEKNFVKV